MNTFTRSAALPFSLALLAVPGFAGPFQGTPIEPTLAQGLFSNTATGISVKWVNSADPLLVRSPGTNGGVPTAWTAGSFSAATAFHPDFSMAALTGHWAPAGITAPIFGGISTGGEIMPQVDADGALQMTTNNWFMLAITVDSTSKGVAGSLLRQRTANGTINAAGDILSYYAIGSTGINPALVNTVRLESSMAQLKTQQVAPATNLIREITNHDIGLGIIAEDELNQAGIQFPARDSFYFTLTKGWVAAALLVNPQFSLGGARPNSSTVYGMTWSMTPTPQWSAPFIVFSHATLFPGLAANTVEIDALSVDRGSHPSMSAANAPKRVVFSLTRNSNAFAIAPNTTFNQILVYQSNPFTVTTRPLMTDPLYPVIQPLSQTFTTKIGLRENVDAEGQPDDVTSTCGGDPKEGHAIGPVFALATDQIRAGAGTLGLSALRTTPITTLDSDDPVWTDTLHIQVTGMDHADDLLGFIQLFTEDPSVPPELWGPAFWIDAAAAQRNTIEVQVPLPSVISNQVFRFSATCYGVIFTPAPVAVPLRYSWVLSIKT